MHALGRLPKTETATLLAHADGCPGCRAELDGLRAMAGALGHADPDRVSRLPAPPPWLRESVLTAVGTRHARRRRRRLAWAGGLAAAAAIAGVTLLSGLSGTDRPTVAYGSGGMRVSAELDARQWGTAVDLSVSGLTTGQRYLVWLEHRDGSRIPAGSFTARGMGLTMELSAAVQGDEVVALGLSTVPGGPAVLRALISR
ncbi:anti-sigma factor RsiW [Streptosporangium brasiliense]|uniref:Anti-sigma factor RsiW n=2 Tax=Streptosporangiaceae TaxID=2004 RepID=A0ABT9RKD8_9ACTN|nr:anti-sigma factor RsiW [Streptosporangium brasiliense]